RLRRRVSRQGRLVGTALRAVLPFSDGPGGPSLPLGEWIVEDGAQALVVARVAQRQHQLDACFHAAQATAEDEAEFPQALASSLIAIPLAHTARATAGRQHHGQPGA